MSTVCRGLLAPLAAAVAASAHIAWSQRHRALACDFQPKNAVEFPTSIEHERHGRYELVATGVRKVTFLSIRVYNVGLYVATKDVPKIVARLSALALEDRQALQASLADPERGAAVMEDIAKEVGIMIRIVPVRDTVSFPSIGYVSRDPLLTKSYRMSRTVCTMRRSEAMTRSSTDSEQCATGSCVVSQPGPQRPTSAG